jgi:hypothetical protein
MHASKALGITDHVWTISFLHCNIAIGVSTARVGAGLF